MKVAVRLLLVLALVAPAFDSVKAQVQSSLPTCQLFSNATTVKANTRVRLDWSTTNATSGYLNEVGAIAPKGFSYVVPGKNTTYTASFTGPGGSVVCRIAVAVSAGAPVGGSGGGSVDGGGAIDTSVNPIDTNRPVNLDRTVNLGGNVTLPTSPTVAPTTPTSGGGGLLGGIVPAECRSGPPGSDPLNTVKNCDFCALNQLMQNLINFLLGLTIPIAALLFAWAGILFFSSRGEPAQINRAKGIFKTVVIGFVIAISAWILVNTIINMLVTGTEYKNWSWNSLDCTATRLQRQTQINKTIQDYLNSSLPGLQSYTPASSHPAYSTTLCGSGSTYSESIGGCVNNTTNECEYSGCGVAPNSNSSNNSSGALTPFEGDSCPSTATFSQALGGCVDRESGECTFQNCGVLMYDSNPSSGVGGSCPAGYKYTQDSKESWCENPNNPDDWVDTDGSGGVQGSGKKGSNPEFNNQLANACTQLKTDCGIAGRIATNESSGGRNCTTSSTGAAGCMQVLATTACDIDSSISDACGACTARRQSKSPQCAPVIQAIESNQQLGVNLGVQYISNMQNMPALQKYQNQYGDCQITAAAYYAGPTAVIKANGVISNVAVPAGAPSASQYVATACR